MKPKLADFSIIDQHIQRAKADYTLVDDPAGFYYVFLRSIFDLEATDIEDAITDDHFWLQRGRTRGKDRGIDAVVIQEDENEAVTVHLCNFKYVSKFERTQGFFPSNEIDKVLAFIALLSAKDSSLITGVTQNLEAKVKEIWDLYKTRIPKYVIHLVSNLTDGLDNDELTRLQKSLQPYKEFSVEIHTQSTLALKLANRDRMVVNGKFVAIGKDLFEKAGGDIRALIVHAEARQLIRLLCDDGALRLKPDEDISKIKLKVCEGAFEDNVRVYLTHRSKVNKQILKTLLENSHRFFYFNNGITITCDRFQYSANQQAPVIVLENLQVVNGGQTIHAFFDAFEKDPATLASVQLLCRIYETTNAGLGSEIAQATNTQTPVKTRDIRSIDITQIKLEKEFRTRGLFYERKKDQFRSESKPKRVDAERCGQAALAFRLEMPLEAKNKKRLIFGEKYDEIFSESTNSEILLFPLKLLERIESEHAKITRPSNLWRRFSNYHMLYALKLVGEDKGLMPQLGALDAWWKLYPKAEKVIARARKAAKAKGGEKYEDVLYFKNSAAKTAIATLV